MSRRIPASPIVCLLIGAMASGVVAEIIAKDDFPGYAEEPNWVYYWNVGVGSTTFDANGPGFAHLNLDGPAGGGTYHNAELKNYNMTYRVPPYCDLEIRLRNSNNNGFDSPGGPNDPDPNYGIGSRGWGFWNDSMDPFSTPMNTIWFVSLSPQSADELQGSRFWVIRDNMPWVLQNLDTDLTEWHTYRIKWRQDYLAAYIDDMADPIVEITQPSQIPSAGMNFTVWCDNYIMTGTFPDFDIGYLPVPAIQQYIDVDYVRIYTAEAVLTLDVANGLWGTVQVEPNYPTYAEGSEVTLTAEPIEGREFSQWELYDPNHPNDSNYSTTDTNSVVHVVMMTDRAVTAIFKCGSPLGLSPFVALSAGALAVIARRRRAPRR